MNGTNPPPVPEPVTFYSKTSALAVWSLVLGIAAFFFNMLCVGILLAIPAVICGHMALTRIKGSNGLLSGQGVAIGGLITGYINIALAVVCIPLLMAIAIPNFVKARDTAMANACINNLRQIDAAKQEWALEHGKKPDDVPTTQDLLPYLKNQKIPVCPAGGTYTIGKVSTPPTCTVTNHVLP